MLENTQLRIRIGNSYDGEDGVFRNATFAEAIEALTPKTTSDDADSGYISTTNVMVVGTYINGFSENLGTSTKPRVVERQADQPIFGLEVTVYGPRNAWKTIEPAQVNWSALGSNDVETTFFYAQLMTTAAQLASAVNAAL